MRIADSSTLAKGVREQIVAVVLVVELDGGGLAGFRVERRRRRDRRVREQVASRGQHRGDIPERKGL